MFKQLTGMCLTQRASPPRCLMQQAQMRTSLGLLSLTRCCACCARCVTPPQVPDVNGILDRLLLFLGYEKDFVTAESLIQARADVWIVVLQGCKGMTQPCVCLASICFFF